MSMGKPYPPEIRERAQRLAADGWPPKQISVEVGVPLKSICDWLPKGSSRPRYDEAVKKRAHDLHRQGVAPADIARALGVHAATVHYWLKNVRIKRKKPHSPETIRRVLARIDSGETLHEAAVSCRVPVETIRNWIRQRDSEAMAARLYGGDRRARYAIHRPALALALSGAWR